MVTILVTLYRPLYKDYISVYFFRSYFKTHVTFKTFLHIYTRSDPFVSVLLLW